MTYLYENNLYQDNRQDPRDRTSTLSSMAEDAEDDEKKPKAFPFPSLHQDSSQEFLDSDLLHPDTIVSKFNLNEEWEAFDSMKKLMQLFATEGELELITLIASNHTERALDRLSFLTNQMHDKLMTVEKSFQSKVDEVIQLQRQVDVQKFSTSSASETTFNSNPLLLQEAAQLMSKLETERYSLEQRLREVSAQHAIHLSDMQHRIDELEFQLEMNKQTRVVVSAPSTSTPAQTPDRNNNNNSAAEITELKNQRRILLHHLKHLDQELHASKNKQAEEVKELEALRETIRDIMSELRYRNEQSENLTESMRQLEEENKNLLEKIQSLDEQSTLLAESKELQAALQQQLTGEQAKNDMLVSAMQVMEQQWVTLQEEHTAVSTAKQDLERIQIILQEELEEERQQNQSNQVKCQHLELQLKQMMEDLLPSSCVDYSPSKYVEEKRSQDELHMVISKEEEDKQRELKRGKYLDKLVRQNSKLMNQLSESDGKMKSTESELHRLKRELSEFRNIY